MNAREQARFDALKRVGTFGTNINADLTTPVPPAALVSTAQTKAKTLFDNLNTPDTGLLALIAKNAGSQASGSAASQSGTTSKAVLRDAIFLDLKAINRTAAAIATEQNSPGLMDQFRMPYGSTDVELVAKAGAIADAAEAKASDFTDFGIEATFVDDLRAHIAAFESADATQNTGSQTESGATAEFEPLLREGMKTLTKLNAFVRNFYKTNAEKLGEWATASHVERQPKPKKPATPPPTP